MVTKGQAGKVEKEEFEEAVSLLKKYTLQLLTTADLELGKMTIAAENELYAQVVYWYCIEVGELFDRQFTRINSHHSRDYWWIGAR